MKRADVNLLPTKTRFQLSRIRLAKRLKKAAFAAVAVWLTVVIAVSSFRLFLLMKGKNSASQRTSLEASLSQFSPEMDLQQALRFRLKLLAQTLNSRPLVSEKLKTLHSFFPEDMEIDQLEMDQRKIKISASLASLTSVAELEENLASAGKDKIYQSAKLTGLRYNKKEGRWNFVLELIEGERDES